MVIDTHAHLWWKQDKLEIDTIIENAKKTDVGAIIVPGTDIQSSRDSIALAKKYPGYIYPAIGIHPEEYHEEYWQLEELLLNNRELVVAIGEIGSDANTEEMKNCMDKQKELFIYQANLAIKYDLPLIIHTRKTLRETLGWIDELEKMPKGVFHGFSHDVAEMQEVCERGFLVGFGGNISYSRRIRKLVATAKPFCFVLETDWPFLPSSLTNEPSSVKMLAQIVADLRDDQIKNIESMTTIATKELFGI